MTKCIVIMKNLILCAPHIQLLSLNILVQMLQNIAVELSTDSLAMCGGGLIFNAQYHISGVMLMAGHHLA